MISMLFTSMLIHGVSPGDLLYQLLYQFLKIKGVINVILIIIDK